MNRELCCGRKENGMDEESKMDELNETRLLFKGSGR